MMRDAAVIFRTKQGFTAEYAQWIAEELHCNIYEASRVEPQHLYRARAIIFGGGVYAGKINGLPFLERYLGNLQGRRVAVFSVGLSHPDNEQAVAHIITKNYLAEMQNVIKYFHFQGGLKYNKLGWFDKARLKMMAKMLAKKDPEQLDQYDRTFLEGYTGTLNFCDRSMIQPLIDFIDPPKKSAEPAE